MLGKIYRGGVHRTTPETLELGYDDAVTSLIPGEAVSIGANGLFVKDVPEGAFFYVVGEPLHGSTDDEMVGSGTTPRAYLPRSGDMYAARAGAGIVLEDDLPLTIVGGQFVEADVDDGDEVHAYLNWPENSSLRYQLTGTTEAGQLIPIKIR